MAPLLLELKKHTEDFETRVCVTAQHRKMLDQVLNFFDITPDYDLNIMKPNQTLFHITSDIILGLKEILEEFRPDYVFVHGDTTTTFAASLAAFYAGCKICHIEAGLRTYDKNSPFPEEMNRQLVSKLCDINFAPTITAKNNLLSENLSSNSIIVTGNTVIDALLISSEKLKNYENEEILALKNLFNPEEKLILVTSHRRENHGTGIIEVCEALKEIATSITGVQLIFPVHLNPNIRKTVFEYLKDIPNIHLIDPLGYPAFVWLMNKSYLIITDSGGIQEEAPSLGKPVLVLRENTERPEAVDAGTVILVGTNKRQIVEKSTRLINDIDFYASMANISNPYGKGNACDIIVNHLKFLNNN